MFFQPGKPVGKTLGIFLDLHSAQAHGDDAEMRVERVGRNGDDAFLAAIGVELQAFAVRAV